MGVVYAVVSLDDESRVVLSESNISLPKENGRLPTPNEFKFAVSELSGVNCEYHQEKSQTWTAIIESPPDNEHEDEQWTTALIHEYENDDQPCVIVFEKGTEELIVRAVLELSKTTGPLVLLADDGQLPLVVNRNADLKELLATWELIDDSSA